MMVVGMLFTILASQRAETIGDVSDSVKSGFEIQRLRTVRQ